mgnify:CR=1 FL=1
MSKAIHHSCCYVGKPTLLERAASTLRWIVPGAILVVVPKCPLCIVAYVVAATGIGLSVSTAESIRILLIIVCLVPLAYLSVRLVSQGWAVSK